MVTLLDIDAVGRPGGADRRLHRGPRRRRFSAGAEPGSWWSKKAPTGRRAPTATPMPSSPAHRADRRRRRTRCHLSGGVRLVDLHSGQAGGGTVVEHRPRDRLSVVEQGGPVQGARRRAELRPPPARVAGGVARWHLRPVARGDTPTPRRLLRLGLLASGRRLATAPHIHAAGLGLGVHDHILRVRLALADVAFQPAGEVVGLRKRHVRRHDDTHEHDQAAGRV